MPNIICQQEFGKYPTIVTYSQTMTRLLS